MCVTTIIKRVEQLISPSSFIIKTTLQLSSRKMDNANGIKHLLRILFTVH